MLEPDAALIAEVSQDAELVLPVECSCAGFVSAGYIDGLVMPDEVHPAVEHLLGYAVAFGLAGT